MGASVSRNWIENPGQKCTVGIEIVLRGQTISPTLVQVNAPNCLSKNLLESDSLPQLRNLLEISFTIASFETGKGGEAVEVKDGGTQSSG